MISALTLNPCVYCWVWLHSDQAICQRNKLKYEQINRRRLSLERIYLFLVTVSTSHTLICFHVIFNPGRKRELSGSEMVVFCIHPTCSSSTVIKPPSLITGGFNLNFKNEFIHFCQGRRRAVERNERAEMKAAVSFILSRPCWLAAAGSQVSQRIRFALLQYMASTSEEQHYGLTCQGWISVLTVRTSVHIVSVSVLILSASNQSVFQYLYSVFYYS